MELHRFGAHSDRVIRFSHICTDVQGNSRVQRRQWELWTPVKNRLPLEDFASRGGSFLPGLHTSMWVYSRSIEYKAALVAVVAMAARASAIEGLFLDTCRGVEGSNSSSLELSL